MGNNLLEHIIKDIRYLGKSVVLIENPDGFLLRRDVIKHLSDNNISINHSTKTFQRIAYELRDKENYSHILLLVSSDNTQYLEDIMKVSAKFVFQLVDYVKGYHLNTILNFDLGLLNKLYNKYQIFTLSKKDTEEFAKSIDTKIISEKKFDIAEFQTSIHELISAKKKDWYQIIKTISKAIQLTIGTTDFDEVTSITDSVNEIFQKDLNVDYEQSLNSNAIKKPKIVSKILDHISFIKPDRKIALIVIDGMSFWQYQMLNKSFPPDFNYSEDYTYSLIPSITQLSRQAIFRGGAPHKEYTQNPRNEEKLWVDYWENKGINKSEIRYNHEKINLTGIERISKFACVYSSLDEKMHDSTDYADLFDLTSRWIKRSKIISVISKLIDSDFTVYLTTDHGNIEAKGWRRLKGREKLGTNKSGSKSQRHIEYSENNLVSKFMESNEDILGSLVKKENVLYFKDNLSFSPKEHLVTHGGSHLLEVIIPFIKIVK